MTRNGLYQTLLASMYALNGVNGEFLGALATPLNNVVREETGVLATIPAVEHRNVLGVIRWNLEAIEEEKALWEEDHGEPWDSGASLLSRAYVEELERDVRHLRTWLAT